MKILVLGASGMAGHVVSLYLRENGLSVDTLSSKTPLDKDTHLIDVADTSKFKTFLDEHHYDVVINCIGVLVKQSEERKDLAVLLNSYLPHFLEGYYIDSDVKVIHISSNGVFSNLHPPYTEDSAYDNEGFYGRSKALGEIRNDKDLTIRLSIVGPELDENGASLFNWFYKQSGDISGYTNVIWNGVTTLELAKSIKEAITQNIVGIYHLIPKESISKFELLRLFKEVFERNDIQVKPVEGTPLDGTITSTRKDFNYQVPSYKTMVNDIKIWIMNHPKIYGQYER